jgi:hypothetical protein
MKSDRVVSELTAAIALLMEQLEPKPGSEKLLLDRIRRLQELDAKIERQIAHAKKKNERGTR